MQTLLLQRGKRGKDRRGKELISGPGGSFQSQRTHTFRCPGHPGATCLSQAEGLILKFFT